MAFSDAAGEPFGRRLWLAVVAIAVAAACLQSYGIRSWPMADDEVPSLVEMGFVDIEPQAFSVPANQVGRLPRAVPVWYKFQRFAIDHLPSGEVSYRVPSVVFGVLISALAFLVAARWRGLWFASALAILMNLSQPYVYLVQLDRFYAMPLLLMLLTIGVMWAPIGDVAASFAIVALTILSVLSHNVTVAMLGLAFGASGLAWLVGLLPFRLVVRSGIATAVGGALYVFYLLPIVRGWSSTGNPTPVIVSFAAHAGIPALALASLGLVILALKDRDNGPVIWWAIIMIAGVCLVEITNMTWNPRYFLFFFPALWVVGAYAMEAVARGFGLDGRAVAWFGTVAVLLLPNLASHFIDGSRHDYRSAAAVVIANNPTAEPTLSDDAETISYYLPRPLRRNLFVRTKVVVPPVSEFFLVTRANVWTPLPEIPGRRLDLLAEIYKRRFDEFSHVLRVYRVEAEHQR